MSDHDKPTGWFASSDRPPLPPPLPPAPPELPLYGEPPPPPEERSPSGGRIAVLALAGLGVVAAAVFAFSWLTAGDGADSPEAAVDSLFGALEEEDAIGALEALAPGERKVLREPFEDIVGELQRLGVLDDFDLRKVPGTAFTVDDLQYETTALTDEVVVVEVVGGTIVSRVAPDEFPIGPAVREQVDELEDEGSSLGEPESMVTSFADDPFELVAIEEDGGWHVSLAYTLAEAIRGESDTPLSELGSGPDPVGGDDPEDVVHRMVDAAVALDAEAALTLLPPDEMRALYDYAPLFLPELDESVGEAREEGVAITVHDLDLSVDGDGSVRRVRFESYDIEMVDEYSSSHVTYDGECTTSTTTYDYSEYDDDYGYGYDRADSEETDEYRYCRGDEPDDDTYLGSPLDLGFFSAVSEVEPGLTVVELDGRWYVSPVRSLLDSVVEVLEAMSPEDIESFTDLLGTSASEQFEEVGEAIDEGPSGGSGLSGFPSISDEQYTAIEECYAAYEEYPTDTSDEAWAALDDQVEACLRDVLGDQYEAYFGGFDPYADDTSPTTVFGPGTEPGTDPSTEPGQWSEDDDGASSEDFSSIGGP